MRVNLTHLDHVDGATRIVVDLSLEDVHKLISVLDKHRLLFRERAIRKSWAKDSASACMFAIILFDKYGRATVGRFWIP